MNDYPPDIFELLEILDTKPTPEERKLYHKGNPSRLEVEEMGFSRQLEWCLEQSPPLLEILTAWEPEKEEDLKRLGLTRL